MKEAYFKWHSPNLSKDIEMLVYGHAGLPIIIFPSTMGRYYESKDFKLIDSIKPFIESGKIQVFCPDSIDKLSWYNRQIHPAQKVQNHVWYDKMIQEEIVAKIRYNTPSGKVAVAGASFGGFHAANFAFRHPELVSHLISMSGAFSIDDFMDGHYDENVYLNNPMHYLPNLNKMELWDMSIVLGTSEWDICLQANLQLSEILKKKNVRHWLDVKGWEKHDWGLWRKMLPEYLGAMN